MEPLPILLSAIEGIREPRLFETERGYQGHLAAQMDRLLEREPDHLLRPLVEEEYQKRADRHGIILRPDIVVHIPFDRGLSPSRRDDNYLVILLKLRANQKKADRNFQDLETMCSVLNYPLGVFVNIASETLWLQQYKRKTDGAFALFEVAVRLVDGSPVLLTTAA